MRHVFAVTDDARRVDEAQRRIREGNEGLETPGIEVRIDGSSLTKCRRLMGGTTYRGNQKLYGPTPCGAEHDDRFCQRADGLHGSECRAATQRESEHPGAAHGSVILGEAQDAIGVRAIGHRMHEQQAHTSIGRVLRRTQFQPSPRRRQEGQVL